MDYKRGYEQYKKKCETLEKRVAELEEQHEGWQELLRANDAIVAAVLVTIDASEGKPIRVEKQTISEALEGKYVPMVQVKEEDTEGRFLFYGCMGE